jgi:hypothetical protein
MSKSAATAREVRRMHSPEVIEAIRAKAVPQHCPVCRHQRFSISPEFLLLGTWSVAHQQFLVAPMVTLDCENCGHLMMFRPERLGITVQTDIKVPTMGQA